MWSQPGRGGLVAGLTISPPGTLSLEPFIPRTGLAQANRGNPSSLAGIHPQSWPGEVFPAAGKGHQSLQLTYPLASEAG